MRSTQSFTQSSRQPTIEWPRKRQQQKYIPWTNCTKLVEWTNLYHRVWLNYSTNGRRISSAIRTIGRKLGLHPGGYLQYFLVGRPVLKTLTLFQTKIYDFPYPISDLTFKMYTLFQTLWGVVISATLNGFTAYGTSWRPKRCWRGFFLRDQCPRQHTLL